MSAPMWEAVALGCALEADGESPALAMKASAALFQQRTGIVLGFEEGGVFWVEGDESARSVDALDVCAGSDDHFTDLARLRRDRLRKVGVSDAAIDRDIARTATRSVRIRLDIASERASAAEMAQLALDYLARRGAGA